MLETVTTESGTSYTAGTPQPVIDALESARQSGARVRLFYGDAETGRDWMEENDVTGTVGRSTGTVKIPLMIANRRSLGGGGILTHCIVRMLANGRQVYRHPLYRAPQVETRHDFDNAAGLQFVVRVDGQERARFHSAASMHRWVSFMAGERATR